MSFILYWLVFHLQPKIFDPLPNVDISAGFPMWVNMYLALFFSLILVLTACRTCPTVSCIRYGFFFMFFILCWLAYIYSLLNILIHYRTLDTCPTVSFIGYGSFSTFFMHCWLAYIYSLLKNLFDYRMLLSRLGFLREWLCIWLFFSL